MLDRVTGLHVFARVAALGSLTAAARALGMSQTMATKHMAALESRLGTRLLHRTTRRLTLTEAGRNDLEAVERVLAELEEADRAAAAETVEVRGTLRLNAPVSFGIRWIAPLLPDFAQRHPQLTVDLGLNDRHVDLLEEGWDVVVRIGNLKDSTMVARRLAPCRTVVCAAPDYLARHGRPQTIADLARHNCLGYTLSRTVGTDYWSFGRDRRVGIGVKGTLKANNGRLLETLLDDRPEEAGEPDREAAEPAAAAAGEAAESVPPSMSATRVAFWQSFADHDADRVSGEREGGHRAGGSRTVDLAGTRVPERQVGDGDRSQQVQRLRQVRDRLPGREQHPGGRQGAGHPGTGNALDPDGSVFQQSA